MAGSQPILISDMSYLSMLYESLRTSDKSKLQTATSFNLPIFLEKVHELIYSRTENSMNTIVLFDQVEFMISNNKDLPFLQFINKNCIQTVNKCIVFALAYFRFKREGDYCIESVTRHCLMTWRSRWNLNRILQLEEMNCLRMK